MVPSKLAPSTIHATFLLARRQLSFPYRGWLSGDGCPCLVQGALLRLQNGKGPFPEKPPGLSCSIRAVTSHPIRPVPSENWGQAVWRTLRHWLFCFPSQGCLFLVAQSRRDSEPNSGGPVPFEPPRAMAGTGWDIVEKDSMLGLTFITLPLLPEIEMLH